MSRKLFSTFDYSFEKVLQAMGYANIERYVAIFAPSMEEIFLYGKASVSFPSHILNAFVFTQTERHGCMAVGFQTA